MVATTQGMATDHYECHATHKVGPLMVATDKQVLQHGAGNVQHMVLSLTIQHVLGHWYTLLGCLACLEEISYEP